MWRTLNSEGLNRMRSKNLFFSFAGKLIVSSHGAQIGVQIGCYLQEFIAPYTIGQPSADRGGNEAVRAQSCGNFHTQLEPRLAHFLTILNPLIRSKQLSWTASRAPHAPHTCPCTVLYLGAMLIGSWLVLVIRWHARPIWGFRHHTRADPQIQSVTMLRRPVPLVGSAAQVYQEALHFGTDAGVRSQLPNFDMALNHFSRIC